jgi:acyl dehydratase
MKKQFSDHHTARDTPLKKPAVSPLCRMAATVGLVESGKASVSSRRSRKQTVRPLH